MKKLEIELKELNEKIEVIYKRKEQAKEDGNYSLAQELNYKLNPLIEKAGDLEFKLEFE